MRRLSFFFIYTLLACLSSPLYVFALDQKYIFLHFLFVFVQIRKLSRWEVIHVVRTMSTEAAKSGEGGTTNLLLTIVMYLRTSS